MSPVPMRHRSIRLPVDLDAELVAEAERRGAPWSVSAVAAEAIKAALAVRDEGKG